jgi:hypothetical protein
MTIFEFVGQYFFQNGVFKLQEDFSEHGIRVFFENGLGSIQEVSYFTDLRQARGAKKIPKPVLKTRLKIKETTYTLVLVSIKKTLWSLYEAIQLGHF